MNCICLMVAEMDSMAYDQFSFNNLDHNTYISNAFIELFSINYYSI